MTNEYELSTSGGLKSTGSCGLPSAAVTDGTLRWVRLIGPLSPELRSELRALELPNQVFETLHGSEAWSQVSGDSRALLVNLPLLARGEQPSLILRAACTPATLVTAELEALPEIDRVVSERSSAARPGWTLSGLLIELLDAAVTGEGLAYLSLRHKLDDLADAVEKNPLEVSPDALLAMRRQVAQLSILTEDQSYGFMELQRHYTKNPLSDSSRELLRGLVSDADRGLKLLAQMENRLRDLRQHQSQCLQESTNRRLNMLAILSAMYLPPTLIAGIYGMNVQGIPITKLSNGYLLVILFMASVVLGHLWFFYRRGWFK